MKFLSMALGAMNTLLASDLRYLVLDQVDQSGRHRAIRRIGPKFSRTYKPNGARECARRVRQLAKKSQG